MKSKIARTAAMLTGAGLMLSAAVLFAIDGATPNQPPNSDLEVTDPAVFIQAANMINRTEIEMGRLVKERGQSDPVRKLGERMMQDYTILEDKIKDLAAHEGVVLATLLDSRHQRMIDELAVYSGTAFDRHYVEDQIKSQKQAIPMFQLVAAENQDRSVREYAASIILILQQHQQLAEKDSKIMNEPAGASQ